MVTLDTPSIQDLDWWIQEMRFNCTRRICTPPPPPAKHSYFYRLQRFRMGCHSKSGQNSRLMERQSVGLAHQYKRANDSFSCSTAVIVRVHVQLSLDNTTAVAHLNHQGGTKSVLLSALATEIWCWCLERSIYLSAIHIPG